MARVIAALVRHGDYHQMADAPSALQPFPLSEAGRMQAEAGAEWLREVLEREGWSLHPLVHSSRLLRAWQTAQIMADYLAASQQARLEIESYDDLAERSVGSVANLTQAQIEAVLRDDPRFADPPEDWKSNSHYRLPLQGAESLLEAGLRVAEHLETSLRTLAASCRLDTVKLFVGHGAAFRHAAHHLGVLSLDQVARLSMYHCRAVLIERLAPGQWRHVGGEWKLRKQNDRQID